MPGDEIYVLVSSRGAFTARSYAGLTGACAILQRSSASRSNGAVELHKTHGDTDAFRQKLLESCRHVALHSSVSEQRIDQQDRECHSFGIALRIRMTPAVIHISDHLHAEIVGNLHAFPHAVALGQAIPCRLNAELEHSLVVAASSRPAHGGAVQKLKTVPAKVSALKPGNDLCVEHMNPFEFGWRTRSRAALS